MMPLTVITLSKVPNSLKGDLTKWMQEISTGVYIGNFNVKVREELWKRVVENVSSGEATMTYATRNELGYKFQTFNSNRVPIDYDGLQLVMIPNKDKSQSETITKTGYSDASKYRKARKFIGGRSNNNRVKPYVIIDIETDGLSPKKHQIIEIAAMKVLGNKNMYFSSIVAYEGNLPNEVTELTGITNELLITEGRPLEIVLKEFKDFIGDYELVGYNINFDIRFLNQHLASQELQQLTNKVFDLMQVVKKEKMFLKNYKLETVLKDYGISDNVPHRALEDVKLIGKLAGKVNGFRSSR